MERDVLALLMYPFRSRASRCTVTPRRLEMPNAFPISRIEGGYPLSFTYSRINFRIRSCLSVSPLVMVESPHTCFQYSCTNKCTMTVVYCQVFTEKNLKLFLLTPGYARISATFQRFPAFDNASAPAVP